MFTGIISHQGKINHIKDAGVRVIEISCSFDTANLSIGDSVAVDGVCLTVTNISGNFIQFDVMQVTLDKTNLKEKKEGDTVHLELPLVVGDSYGGHMVSGHVDTTVKVVDTHKDGDALWIFFSLPQEYAKLFVPQGSVAINGVSLTIAALTEDQFGVSLIPHTQKVTMLSSLKIGEKVNIECDMFAKHVSSLVSHMLESHDRYRKD